MIDRRSLMKLSVTAALAPGLRSRPAHAQAWPTRIVRLVVPFPPGGGMDAAARILANRLSEIWGRQVVIENKGGAGTNLGTEMAARSEPDGYTMLIGAIQLAVNRYLFPSLGYDAITDFAPVTLICEFPNLMVVPNSSPAKTVLEFIAFAKANGGKTTFASSGIGASGHLGGELFKRMAGIEMTRHGRPDRRPGRHDVQHHQLALADSAGRSVARTRGDQRATLDHFTRVPDGR